MRSKLLRLFVIALAGLYVYWLLQREYRHKYLHVGAMNAIVWRALNAATPDLLARLATLDDAALGIAGNAPRCAAPPDKLEFPVTCNFLGGNFGGKSRNCRFWWLGRQCRIFFVPEAAYAKPYVQRRLRHAFTRPCQVLFEGSTKSEAGVLPLGSYGDMLNSFNCRGPFSVLPFEIQLQIIARDGTIRVERHYKK